MKSTIDFFRNFFTGASGKLRAAVVLVILSAVALRFPVLTAWLGPDIQDSIMKTASEIKEWAWATVMLFVKQYNVTGGTKDSGTRPDQAPTT